MKNISLSDYLKDKRVKAGFTQMDVANHLGYTSAQFISNWERGISAPPVETLKKISSFYGLKLEEVYTVVLETSIRDIKKDLHNKLFGSKASRLRRAN